MKYIVLVLMLLALSSCATQQMLHGYVAARNAYEFMKEPEEEKPSSFENFESWEEK